MSFAQFLLVLRARRWIILLTTLAATALAVGISLALPKKYTATATLVVDSRPIDPIAGIAVPMLNQAQMATQVDILTSQRVALRVVKMLKLDEAPAVQRDFKEDTDGRGSLDVWLATLLRKNLEAKPARDSSVLDVSFTAVDPTFAAVITNAFARAYVDTTLELKVEPARQYAAWFEERSKAFRENLERAQRKLSDYQREAGIVASDERIDVENARLAELSSQLVGMQSASADSRSRQRQARTDAPDALPDVLGNPLLQSLRGDIVRTSSKLQDLKAQLGPNHPQVLSGEAELESLREKLGTETAKVVGGISSVNTVNVQRENQVRQSLEAQRAKVLALKRQREQVTVLQQEVETAQKAYDAITQRFNQSNLESLTNQTNIAILSPAVEPSTASSPRIRINTALGLLVGLMLGVGAALLREMADPRVRSIADLRDSLNVPVLATLSGRGAPRRWKRRLDSGRALPGPAAGAT